MSKKSNPTVIGAFVVGAVLLLAAGVAFFGGAELFAKRNYFVAYFAENAKGLRKGSNVMLNGVRVGQVSGMALLIDQETFEGKTEVTMEILPESYIITRGDRVLGKGLTSQNTHEDVIMKGGLRAMLQAESFVTGQLLVELVFRPDTEAVLRGGGLAPYPEIPTVRSDVQELLARIQNFVANLEEGFDMKAIGLKIQRILDGADELVNSQDVRETLASLNELLSNQATQNLPADLQSTLDAFRAAAAEAGSLMRNADGKLDTLAADLEPVFEKLAATLEEARLALVAARAQLQGETIETYQLGSTLKEIEGAARALREFLDYLDRNPEAVLRGKKP